jgi:hypothetical protein
MRLEISPCEVEVKYLYLYPEPGLPGGGLFEKLSSLGQGLQGWAVLPEHHTAEGDPFVGDVVTWEAVERVAPDLVVIDGDPFAGEGRWRVPERLLKRLVHEGAVAVLLDWDFNKVRQRPARYKPFTDFAQVDLRTRDGSVVTLIDEVSCVREREHHVVCIPELMPRIIPDEWLPAFDGVSTIAAMRPLLLVPPEGTDVVVATNERTSSAQVDRTGQDEQFGRGFGAFATASRSFDGIVILIAGIVGRPHAISTDDNLIWLSNLALLATNRTNVTQQHQLAARRSQVACFISHRRTQAKFASELDEGLNLLGFTNAFLDDRELQLGDKYASHIFSAMDVMKSFVLIWSSDCLGRNWVTEHEIPSALRLETAGDAQVFVLEVDPLPSNDALLTSGLPQNVTDGIASLHGRKRLDVAAQSMREVCEKLVRALDSAALMRQREVREAKGYE